MEICIKWNICRVCLIEARTENEEMLGIFTDAKLPHHIEDCAGVTVNANDSLPEKICRKCLVLLRHAVDFRTNCRKSDQYLNNILQRTKSATALFHSDKECAEPEMPQSTPTQEFLDTFIEFDDDAEAASAGNGQIKVGEQDQPTHSLRDTGKRRIEKTAPDEPSEDRMKKSLAFTRPFHMPLTSPTARHVVPEEREQPPTAEKEVTALIEMIAEGEHDEREEDEDNAEDQDADNAMDVLADNDSNASDSVGEESDSAKCPAEESTVECEGDGDATAPTDDQLVPSKIQHFVMLENDLDEDEVTANNATPLSPTDSESKAKEVENVITQAATKSTSSAGAHQMDNSEQEFYYIFEDTRAQPAKANNTDTATPTKSTVIQVIADAAKKDIDVEYLVEYDGSASKSAASRTSSESSGAPVPPVRRRPAGQARHAASTTTKTTTTTRPTPPFVCELCGNTFASRNLRNCHMRVHRADRRYECELCFKRFITSCNLTAHIRTHTGEKRWACQYCDRRFTDRSTHLKHERIHTKEKPFVCDVCGNAFSLSSTLKAHSKIHSGEKPFKCLPCGKAFKLPHQLKAHLGTMQHKTTAMEAE